MAYPNQPNKPEYPPSAIPMEGITVWDGHDPNPFDTKKYDMMQPAKWWVDPKAKERDTDGTGYVSYSVIKVVGGVAQKGRIVISVDQALNYNIAPNNIPDASLAPKGNKLNQILPVPVRDLYPNEVLGMNPFAPDGGAVIKRTDMGTPTGGTGNSGGSAGFSDSDRAMLTDVQRMLKVLIA